MKDQQICLDFNFDIRYRILTPLNPPFPTKLIPTGETMAPAKQKPWPRTFSPLRDTTAATGLSFDKLRQLRQDGILTERIYWVRVPGSPSILWNVPLVIDWLVNGPDSPVHQKAIENFLISLPSSKCA